MKVISPPSQRETSALKGDGAARTEKKEREKVMEKEKSKTSASFFFLSFLFFIFSLLTSSFLLG